MSLTNDDKEYIRTYVSAGVTEEVQRERRKECVTVFGISLAQVSAITAHTKIRANKEIKQQSDIPSGTAMNYDNPIKRKYRKALQNFIAKTFPNIDERGNKKVLCLPGRQCLEIPVYLELGFLPYNIVGVESESTVFHEFLRNASQYGISVRTCDLSKVVNEMPFDVVNFDFCGNMSADVLKNICNLKLAKKSIFCMNLLGGREHDNNKKLIDSYYYSATVLNRAVQFIDFMDIATTLQVGKEKLNQNLAEKKLNSPDVDLADKRDEAIYMMVSRNIGKQVETNKLPNVFLQPRSEETTDTAVVFFGQFFEALMRFRMPESMAIQVGYKLSAAYSETIYPTPLAIDLEQYSYISPSKQRYLADFFSFEYEPPYGTNAKEAINFVYESLTALETKLPKDWGFRVRDKKGFVHDNNHTIQATDSMEMVIDGSTVSQIKMRPLVKFLDQLTVSRQRDLQFRLLYGDYKMNRIPLEDCFNE